MYVKIALIALVTLMAIWLSGCSASGPVPDATCDALDPYLPTWSDADTEETLKAAARFLDVYEAICY